MKFPLSRFYKNKSVLVTGHTGFKGGWLATWLKMMGSRVTGLALPPESDRPSFFESVGVADGLQSIVADVRDCKSVHETFQKCKPEIVFHNAAQALVRRSYRDPVATYATNVMGTVHILEAARKTPSVRAVLIVTSDKCYENREWIWGYREQDPMGGYDPYSSSKGCSELVTAAYRCSFFETENHTLIASARAGNVIGGGDWAEDRLVPDLIRGITNKTIIKIRNPHALRPWQHVLDPLHGYLMLGQRLWQREQDFAQPWNFGPSEGSISVADVANRVTKLWGGGRIGVDKNGSRLHESHYLRLDCSKAQRYLKWSPRLSTDAALRWTVDWYRGFDKDPRCAKQLTYDQIQHYVGGQC